VIPQFLFKRLDHGGFVHSRSQSPRHPSRKLLGKHPADCHTGPSCWT
jgi:hypothetical protein